MSDLLVAGSGMAGLAAAATAGAEVYEKGDRVGGSMALSSGVIWRYREWEEFRQQCPDGDIELQRVVHEGVDDAIAWLESLGAPVLAHETGNPLTVGKRFEPSGLIQALRRHCGPIHLNTPASPRPPLILATGGFQADLALRSNYIGDGAKSMMLRSNPWSVGDGLRFGLEAGGSESAGMDQFYGRAMPVGAQPGDWIDAAQLYARHAFVESVSGERYEGPIGWAEVEVVQWMARQPEAKAWFVVPESALAEQTRYGTVGSLVDRAAGLGSRLEKRDEGVAVEVVAAITQTLGGLKVDRRGRVADGVWAAGGDVGGIATGGYMSNLAAAVVMGRIAALDAMS